MFVEPLENRRLLAGDLDASFGNGGIVTTNFIEVANLPGWSDSASSVALQGDGKLVVAGTTQPNGAPLGAISRYNGDGSLDASFSNDGKISDSRFNTIQDVAIQPDGKIVVVGRGYPMNGAAGNFAIGRFNADGSPDATFGSNGIVITNPGVYDTAYAVALLSDGKILVTGQSGHPGPEQPVGFTVQQFNSDGTVDTSFGNSGQVRTFYSTAEVISNYGGVGNVAARDVIVQPDGKIVVAGYSLELSNRFAVVRYNADGSLDTSFDTDGRVVTSLGLGKAYPASVALQNDGKVVVGGYLHNGASGNADFALVRYNLDGSLDTTFDGDGKLILDYGGTHDYVNDVKVQSDGSIVVTGSVGDALAVARFSPDGSPDSMFGTNGLVTTAVQASAYGSEVVIQPDGAIVVAGTVNNGNGNVYLNRDFLVARYDGNSNTAPTAVVLSNTLTSTAENGGDVKVADIAITDDELGTNVLSLSGADAAFFSLVGNALHFNGGANFEAKSSYSVTVEVDDAEVGGVPDASQEFALTITDVNETPTVIGALSDVTVNQNAADSVISLTGLFYDVDANDTLTITAVSSSSGLVTAGISGDWLTLDYQVNQSGTASITVTATDGSGASVDLMFNVVVLSPAQLATGIRELILQWKADGKINAGVANSMLVKVDNSLKSYDKGNSNTAVNQLNALKNQIEAKTKLGSITDPDAALAISLIDDLFDSMTP